MYVIALNNRMFGQHLDVLTAMYRLRRRVFKERLDWTVSVSGDVELDVYDTLNPIYLLVMTSTRKVAGCVRLLPTTGPTMLADTFPILLDGGVPPRSDRVLESSRFCVDTGLVSELSENGLNRATFMLFAAMIETLRAAGADSIVTVTDIRMERILRRAGWPLARIAAPQRLGQTMALAGFLHASDEALTAMYSPGECHGSGSRRANGRARGGLIAVGAIV
jgi:acyl homoserine lactone synthase